MSKKEAVKRYILFIISLFFIGLGIAFTKLGGLGVSPISSVANVLSCKFTFLSIGAWLFIWNCVLLLGQIIILKKQFPLIQLIQIPLSVLFGYFTDFGMKIASNIPVDSYLMQLVMVFSGIIILGFGISLSVIANVVMNSGEAFVKTVAEAFNKNFGNIKIIVDVSCVAVSVILSMLFFNFKIIGTREGTLIAALGTGKVVNFFTKIMKNKVSEFLMR